MRPRSGRRTVGRWAAQRRSAFDQPPRIETGDRWCVELRSGVSKTVEISDRESSELAGELSARAADGEKKGSEDRKALIEKYDKNKDGKLDREERKAMTADDKEKWQKASGGGKKKKDQ